MNKSKTFKNCIPYIWVVAFVIIGIFIGVSNRIEYEKSYVRCPDVFEHRKKPVFERIIEEGKGQMTYNFIEHNLYDTLLGS